jgi:hypothetical protein
VLPLAVLAALSLASAQASAAPEIARIVDRLGGEWTISERYPQELPMRRAGRGTEQWEFGPDRKWAIYRYTSDSVRGHAAAIAILWWDADARRLKELWCFDSGKTACDVSKATIAWRGDDFVLEVPAGEPGAFRETWSDIRPNSHSMVIEEPDGHGGYRAILLSHAERRTH